MEEVKECLQSCGARRWQGQGSSPDPPVPQTHSVAASKPGPQSLQVEQVNNHTASWTVGKAHGVWGGALPRAGHKTQELRCVEG